MTPSISKRLLFQSLMVPGQIFFLFFEKLFHKWQGYMHVTLPCNELHIKVKGQILSGKNVFKRSSEVFNVLTSLIVAENTETDTKLGSCVRKFPSKINFGLESIWWCKTFSNSLQNVIIAVNSFEFLQQPYLMSPLEFHPRSLLKANELCPFSSFDMLQTRNTTLFCCENQSMSENSQTQDDVLRVIVSFPNLNHFARQGIKKRPRSGIISRCLTHRIILPGILASENYQPAPLCTINSEYVSKNRGKFNITNPSFFSSKKKLQMFFHKSKRARDSNHVYRSMHGHTSQCRAINRPVTPINTVLYCNLL